MKRGQSGVQRITAWLVVMLLALGFSTTAMAQKAITLSDQEVENLVRRSYQYVAMFNVIQKFALEPASGGMFMDGFNRPKASTALPDHNKEFGE